VLVSLDQIDGVDSSYANESGTLIRLSLRPGADSAKVARAVQQVLKEQVEDRVSVQLGRSAAATALQQEEWRDQSQVAQLAVTEVGPSIGYAPVLLAALFLVWAAIGLGLLYWWHRRRRIEGQQEVG
jgi:hypothetical protein